MKILVIPTTDWVRHPVPNRLNFIFDILAEKHDVFVLHFRLKRFEKLEPRGTKCSLIASGGMKVDDPSMYYLLNAPAHLLKIREIVKKNGIDVILSANILPSFTANFAGVPIVFDYLDHLEESASVYYPGSALGRIVRAVVSRITRYNLVHARSVITVTAEFSQFLKGIGVRDVTVVPNGVDTGLLKPAPLDEAKKALGLKGNVLGYVGSLEHWVDLETVVLALPGLDASLLIVGPGLFTDYGEMIKRMAKDLGVEDRLIFTGSVRYEELGKYISAMDIGLNPLKKMKKNEITIGGKVFNYLACGRPVLSSKIISLMNLLDDDLFYYDDVESFISQSKRILGMKIDEVECRAVAERYDWRSLSVEYEKVLKEAIDDS